MPLTLDQLGQRNRVLTLDELGATRSLDDLGRPVARRLGRLWDARKAGRPDPMKERGKPPKAISPERPRWDEFIDATARGSARVGSAALQGAAGIRGMDLMPGTGPLVMSPHTESIPEILERARATKKLRANADFLWEISQNPGLAAQNKDLGSKALNLIGETIPYITATTAAYVTTGPFGAFTVGSLVEGNSAYRTALDHDVPESKAKQIGVGVGIISGAVEAFGGRYAEQLALKAVAKLKGKIAKGAAVFGIGTVIEALEEGAQEVATITGEETYRDVDWNERTTRVLGAMAGGGFLGGTMRGGSMAVRGAFTTESRKLKQAEAAKEGPEDLDAIDAEMKQELAEIQRATMAETPPTEPIPAPEKPVAPITEAEGVEVAKPVISNPEVAKIISDAKPDILSGVETGKAVSVDVVRGFGRETKGEVYESGEGEPAFGEARYSAIDEKFAKHFGPKIEKLTVQLDNPFVLTNDEQLAELVGEPVPRENALRPAFLKKARVAIENLGHDGIIVNVPQYADVDAAGKSAKRLIEISGATQIIEFKPPTIAKVQPPVTAPVEGKVKEQNFTQFATERGLPSDYDITDHSMLSPSGKASQRSKDQAMKRLEKRIEQNKQAHQEYNEAILAGTIIDPSGKVTKERLERNIEERKDKEVSGRIAQIDAQIKFLSAVGKGKRGTIKPSYQKQIDAYQKERDTLEAQPPAVEGKPKGKPGFVDITPVIEVHKTFMRVLEPSKAVERKLGKEAYAAVIKGVHATDVKRVEFEQSELPKKDKVFNNLEEWLDKFPDKDLHNLMMSRGEPSTTDAQLVQRDAIKKLPKELRTEKLRGAIQHIADFNYKYLQSVVGDDINRVADYFYGVYKDSKKVDKFLDYWRTTKRFTKEKKLPTYADAVSYGLEIRDPNPVRNLKSEYVAIAHLEGMNWLKDELLRTGKGKFIDDFPDAPLEWDKVNDPTFSGLRLQPDLAKMVNNLIATNKITKIPTLNTLRQVNNFLRTVKFIGSAFHLLSVAKQSVADSGYFGFLLPHKWVGVHRRPSKTIPVGLHKGIAAQGITSGFRKNDPIFRTPFYKRYVNNGGGHRYSVESEARRVFSKTVGQLNKEFGKAVKVGALPLRIPTAFVNWMFNSYIPKVKYAKTQAWYNQRAKKLGRELTDAELQDLIKEGQNFYGMMNERLFGRSGTVTTSLRFVFMSPGYAEGNYRSMIKAAIQWGGKEGFRASRSRSNIVNSLILTGTLATVGTMIMTGKPPKKPETAEDLRDLFKIDTGRTDDKGRPIMIDLMTYDKDYWNVGFNVLKGRPDEAVRVSIKRIGGMKAPTADMITDLALISMGKAIYDWKGDRVTEITDPFLRRVMKLAVHEVKKLEPISVSVFKQSRRREIDTTIAAMESVLGVRPSKTEKDKREQAVISKIYSLKGQQEELYQYLGRLKDPRRAIAGYNKTVNQILDSKMVPETMRREWRPKLLVDIDRLLENKAHYLSQLNRTPQEVERAKTYLKNFGVSGAQAQELLKKYWARERITAPISPLETDRVIGRSRKRKRLKERYQ